MRSVSKTAFASFCMIAPAFGAVTTESLLLEMTDLNRLCRLPSPAYTTRQYSSYNRKSKSPDDYEGWFANADRGEYLRVEGRDGQQEYVMMDADGPGAIVRIWSADPKGTLRIYLDAQAKPVIEADMKALMAGHVEGFPAPLAHEAARGFNLYFPLPYAKHCKVTSDQGKTYYHINYRTYAPGTPVISFQYAELKRLSQQIRAVADRQSRPAETMEGGVPFTVTIQAGAETTLLELIGPKVIQELHLSVTAPDVDAALRGTLLSITFDGEETVRTPIGDFFGTAPGPNAYESLPMSVRPKSSDAQWISRWRMPFRKTAVVKVINWTTQPVELHGSAILESYKWDDASLLFHAKWRIQRDLSVKPFSDWTHLSCTGEGRFVGGSLNVMNPVRNWWGEGDEKIYVDGEKFPSHFGTGSEDYYGYAWCSPQLFTHAYHNQPRCDGPGNRGNTSVNRFHIMDDIPFTTSFKFDMENLHHRGFRGDPNVKTTRAATSYWYARPGGTDAFQPITREDLKLMAVPPEPNSAEAPAALQPVGAIELSWQKNVLTLHSPKLPSGKLDILYLEAFCRRGSTHRAWDQTTIPFTTELVRLGPLHRRVILRSLVADEVEVRHDIRSTADEVDFQLELENKTDRPVDIDWAQACIRVGDFTGRGQEDYFEKCFIYTDQGLACMNKTHRASDALYTPGQVYVPAGIDLNDVNPRPISQTRPANGLVGCFSADGKMLLATAWSRTQELFQGIIVCIHSDFRIGGLKRGETKRLRGKIYLMANEPDKLLARYQQDFGPNVQAGQW